MGSLGIQAQNYPPQVEYFDFINYEKNHLEYYGDSSKWEYLFSRFDSLLYQGTGKITMLHMGGSHIQADVWSERMRERLQGYANGVNGGRGWLFPFKMARTNNPYNYFAIWDGDWDYCKNTIRKECDLGVSGIRVTTSDTLTHIKINFREALRGRPYQEYDINKVTVLHNTDSSSYSVEIFNPGVIYKKEVDTIIGCTRFYLQEYIPNLELVIRKTDSLQNEFTLYGIYAETDDPGFVYNAIGVNGASTNSYLKCNKWAEQMKVMAPDMVVFSIGINDAYEPGFNPDVYYKNYCKLMDDVLAANPNATFLLTSNNDSYYKRRYPNPRAKEAREVMYRLSKKYNCAFWDMFEVMGGLGSVDYWIDEGLAKTDKIHLTREGYHMMGDLMFSAIMEGYANYQHKQRKGD